MIALGLLLILLAVGAVGFAITAPSAAAQTIEVSALGFTISASPLAMFLAGAVSVLLLGFGFALVNRGARRKASSRKELRELRKGQAATAAPTSAEAGQHSSRRDRPQQGSTGDTSISDKTGADGSTETTSDSAP